MNLPAKAEGYRINSRLRVKKYVRMPLYFSRQNNGITLENDKLFYYASIMSKIVKGIESQIYLYYYNINKRVNKRSFYVTE